MVGTASWRVCPRLGEVHQGDTASLDGRSPRVPCVLGSVGDGSLRARHRMRSRKKILGEHFPNGRRVCIRRSKERRVSCGPSRGINTEMKRQRRILFSPLALLLLEQLQNLPCVFVVGRVNGLLDRSHQQRPDVGPRRNRGAGARQCLPDRRGRTRRLRRL
jgi:hypothetical protein